MSRYLRRIVPMGVVVVAFAAGARADDSFRLSPPTEKALKKSRSTEVGGKAGNRSASSWTTTAGALLFVVGLVVVTAKVLRKSLPRYAAALPAEAVEVLGRKALDQRHTLHVVRCGSRLVILGTSNDGVRTLTEITDPEEVDALTTLCQPAQPSGLGMRLDRMLERLRPTDETPGSEVRAAVEDSASFDGSDAPDAAALRLRRHLNTTGRPPETTADDTAEAAA